jgi:hypothetical protein
MAAPLKDPSEYGGGTVPLNLRIPPEIKRGLMETSDENFRTVADEVRAALAFYLRAQGKDPTPSGD